MRRSITKQLTCPVCGVVLAEATYTRLPADLVLSSTDGYLVQPDSVSLQLVRARAERAGAPSAGAEQLADARIEFLERNMQELVYDLRCRNGHSTLRTMPQLVRAIRRSRGSWVDLG